MIQFEWWPVMLLLPLPWLLRRFQRKGSAEATAGRHQALWVPFYQQTQGFTTTMAGETPHPVVRLLTILAWLMLLLALARPQWVGDPIALPQEGRDLFLAIDLSPSMLEQDMVWRNRQTNRLETVKAVVSEFIRQRQGDRMGLILFGTQPYVQAPLTFDLATVETLLKESAAGMAGESTSLGDAIGLAIKRLQNRPEQQRVVILLTDGRNTSGEVSPEEAARQAARYGIKVYTIGVGSDEPVRRGLLGRLRNPSADLDEALLTDIAQTTGARYFRAKSSSELELVYEALNQLEPVEQESRMYRPVTEYYWLPALFFLLMSVLSLLARVLPGGWPGRVVS